MNPEGQTERLPQLLSLPPSLPAETRSLETEAAKADKRNTAHILQHIFRISVEFSGSQPVCCVPLESHIR